MAKIAIVTVPGRARAAQARARASSEMSDRMPLQASVTPSEMWLRWMTFPSMRTGTPM